MAKKKQLAGKKTKLANLPLTQALAAQAAEASPWEVPALAPEPGCRQLPLSWEQVGQGINGPLALAYLQLIRELAVLQAELLLPGVILPRAPLRQTQPTGISSVPRLKVALHQALTDLQDLRRLLSQD
jgi:hypothetical protein